MRISRQTLRLIADDVAAFGVDADSAESIVLAIIAWYEELRKVCMRISTQGCVVGRPRKMSPRMVEDAKKLRALGLSYAKIGAMLGVRGCTVWYELLPKDRRAKQKKRLRAGVDRWRAARETPI
jgi:hypothetical protein